MAHNFREKWVTGGDKYEPVEYTTQEGYWSCYHCLHTVVEGDEDYQEWL